MGIEARLRLIAISFLFSFTTRLIADWGRGLGTAGTLTRERRACPWERGACPRRSIASLKPPSPRGSSAGRGGEEGGAEGGCGYRLDSTVKSRVPVYSRVQCSRDRVNAHLLLHTRFHPLELHTCTTHSLEQHVSHPCTGTCSSVLW